MRKRRVNDWNVGRVGDINWMHGVVISRQEGSGSIGIGCVMKLCCLHWIRTKGENIARLEILIKE